ncbi:MAG TPA: diaminopimelate epimerase, partial [Caldithrix sp.]|nr:diaminopimelate epimerase [Caldithrix sp.]
MVTHIPFTKMHGAGNDFILIDNRQEFFSGDETELFRNLCRRHFGIGADGLLLIQFWHNGEFDVAFFNPDGKPAAMCGNGAR